MEEEITKLKLEIIALQLCLRALSHSLPLSFRSTAIQDVERALAASETPETPGLGDEVRSLAYDCFAER